MHLAKPLREKYGRRNITARKGDTVKVMRGQFRGKTGKIDRVTIKATRVYIIGIDRTKKDGTKTTYPFHPSNLLLTELSLEDKKRIKQSTRT